MYDISFEFKREISKDFLSELESELCTLFAKYTSQGSVAAIEHGHFALLLIPQLLKHLVPGIQIYRFFI